VTLTQANGKTSMAWTAFSECLESPELFVLWAKPKHLLLAIPKRAFPSATDQDWFREQAAQGRGQVSGPSELPIGESSSADQIRLTIELRFRDYLARTLTTCLLWAFCLLVSIPLTFPLLAAANRPANGAEADKGGLLVFMLMPLFGMAMGLVVFSMQNWRLNAVHSRSELAVSEGGIAYADADGSGRVPWSSFQYYKETPWLFIVWGGRSSLMFPKRAFTSGDDVERFRDLLQRHLQRSRWLLR
jgi:hypothetical protein